MSSTFSFTAAESDYRHKISSNVILHLYRSNHAVAIVEFIDEMSNQIPIPTGFLVYTKDFQTNQYIKLKPIGNFYALCWTDDYVMEFNDEIIFDIRNDRNWDITSLTPDTHSNFFERRPTKLGELITEDTPDVQKQYTLIPTHSELLSPPMSTIFLPCDERSPPEYHMYYSADGGGAICNKCQRIFIPCDEKSPPENHMFVYNDDGAICNKCQRFVPSIAEEEDASDDESEGFAEPLCGVAKPKSSIDIARRAISTDDAFLAEQQMDEDIDRRWITSDLKIAESYNRSNPARYNECFICGNVGHYGKDCAFDANWHQDINNGCWTFYYCDGCGKEFLEEDEHEKHEKTCNKK